MIAAATCGLLVALGGAFHSPRVSMLAPAGGQRGTEVTVVITGQRLVDPQELMLTSPGLEVVRLEGDKPESCTATLRILPDCPLGPHPLRLRTVYGITNLVLFHVGAAIEVSETRDGTAPMPLALDHTVNANISGEEADRYALDLEAGARVHCEVMAMRLGFSAIDLRLDVLGPDGAIVATADDTALGQKDPHVTFSATQAGTYLVQVAAAFADATNSGSYRLSAGTFPRPLGALPAGGQPGETIDVELLGDVAGARARVTLPDDGTQVFRYYPQRENGAAPSPILLRVGGPPNVTPTVDDKGRALVTFPASVHGVINAPDQVARYFFVAKKGEVIEFRALARTLRSPLDPALIAREAGGRFLAYNDDGGGGNADSLLTFTAPADGEFSIEVRDLLRRGSEASFFRLEGAARSAPMNLRMVVGRQEQPVLALPQGGRVACVLQTTNFDAGKDLRLLARDLPTGVTATFGPLLRGSNLVPLLLQAEAETPLAGAQVAFDARAANDESVGDPGYVQVLPLVTVRNDQAIFSTAQRRLPVAVTKPAPFALAIEAPNAPLVRGAPMGVKVRVTRDEGCNDDIRVRAVWTSPGVNAGQVVIPGKSNEIVLPVEATSAATLGTFPLAVSGTVGRGGGVLELASGFTDLDVVEPWVTAEVGKARTLPGNDVELRVPLARKQPISGPYRAALLNLPRGVTAPEIDLAADADVAVFALTVATNAQAGRHRSFVVELRLPAGAGIARHRFGGGEIRVDAPPADDTNKTTKGEVR